MHRSGTSAVAGCLQRLGVEFGPRLMPPTEANKRGYYEHIDVVNLHDRLLMALDRGWDTIRPWPDRWWEDQALTGRFREELLVLLRKNLGAAPLWGVKDPRLCLLLPWWRPLWALLDTAPVFIIVVRDPGEVALSLARREGMSRTKACLLWREHLLAAEKETRGCERHFIRYEGFLRDPVSALEPLEQSIGPAWKTALLANGARCREFADPALRRAVATNDDASLATPEWLREDARWLDAGCELADRATPAVISDGKPSVPQPDAERLRDLAVELSAARRLARWYEAEWNKAKRLADKRLTRSGGPGKVETTAHSSTCADEKLKSNVRIHFLSFVRKCAAHGLQKLARILDNQG